MGLSLGFSGRKRDELELRRVRCQCMLTFHCSAYARRTDSREHVLAQGRSLQPVCLQLCWSPTRVLEPARSARVPKVLCSHPLRSCQQAYAFKLLAQVHVQVGTHHRICTISISCHCSSQASVSSRDLVTDSAAQDASAGARAWMRPPLRGRGRIRNANSGCPTYNTGCDCADRNHT